MDNKQTATANKLMPNTTQIPNVLLDEWMPMLTCSEFKIILVIARQTYGWHKETEWIAYSQFVEKTGLNQDSIATALKSLKLKGYVQVFDRDNNSLDKNILSGKRHLYYRINYLNSEKPSFKTRKFRDTKETNTKLSISKDITKGKNPGVDQVLEEFSQVTGLSSPADRQPRRVAWNFIQKYGVKEFRPALEYLQALWKKDITKIETVKLHYPTYQKDVLKVTRPGRVMSEEEQLLQERSHT